jgi:hypothetical protein
MAARIKENLLGDVVSYFATRDANGIAGLVLIDRCIRSTAVNRDWSGLSSFVTLANRAGHGNRVKKIIRAAFGDKLIYKVDKHHPTGGTFVMGWDAGKPFPLANTYSIVSKAIEDKTSWDSLAFTKALSEVLPAPVKPAPAVDEKATLAAAVHMYRYFKAKIDADMDKATLRRFLEQMIDTGREIVK